MAKSGGLGKGLGALLKETSSAPASVSAIGGLAAKPSANKNIPDCIEVDDNGGLWIDPALLVPNPQQPRVEFNQKQLEELAESIRVNGILQPIIIEQAGEKEFYIIAGERRTRASRLAGLTKVPVQLRKFDEQQKLEMALIENIQRTDLNPIEEAMAYRNLVQMSDLTQEEVAKRVGKARTTVANSIRLLNLPEDIQKALISGQITSGHARALLMVKSDSDMRVMFGKILGSGLSVREAEAMADNLNNGGRASATKKVKKASKKDPDVALFEQQLKNLFGVRGITLNGTIDKGSIVIEYSSKNDFDRICDILKLESN
ncbi:ParB-like partition protein [Treponema sp. JC4]|uniref:ParB/RepB/Spo0J family partition protein n=1 Tax=Treponema sp. JC4 TaxID=1124982 RepID=UPI00025B0BC9|nr:ParB/RepB/Spo0J family partition protein [Treponema sp. JC4]EID85945.1 ParB-like partition protein [Treponema sp. JC4]